MFFYKDTPVKADTKEELLSGSVCPICGGQLRQERLLLPLCYSLRMFIRTVASAIALSLLLGLLMLQIPSLMDFIDELPGRIQFQVSAALMFIPGSVISYFANLADLKLGHIYDYTHLYGLRCSTCGCGFAGIVPYFQAPAEEEDGMPPLKPGEIPDSADDCHSANA